MRKCHLHIWLSIVGAVLISVFSDYTHYDVSYLLRIPGYMFSQYVSLYVNIRIGQETFYLSVIKVVFYSFLIFAVLHVISKGRTQGQQSSSSGKRVLLALK